MQNLQRVVAYAREDEFARRVMENKLAVQRTEQEQSKRKLEKQKRRIPVPHGRHENGGLCIFIHFYTIWGSLPFSVQNSK